MATFERGDVRIHYEVRGEGAPVLLIAPGGMRSDMGKWDTMPWNPRARLGDGYRVIAMDQRNAGESFAPVRADTGWADYTSDQLALLDHLDVDRCLVIGMCIGGPYIVRLINAAPDRVAAAVMFQPIGATDDNRIPFEQMFDAWRDDIAPSHPEATDATWRAMRDNMWGGDAVLFGATRDDIAACDAPLLVPMGDDLYHPAEASREVVRLAPNAELIERWKEGDDLADADAKIQAFLAAHRAG